MKRITSRKESRRSSISSKPPAPAGSLQYFTYDDVAAAAEPKVGDFPQHGDTVALGAAEEEAELARSRASKRISQTIEGREHEDIFANAPEEPLAPEEPRQGSRRGSRRSSRRGSRPSSVDYGLAPSSSRGSRAISPEREAPNGYSAPRSRRDSGPGTRRISRRTSDTPLSTAQDHPATTGVDGNAPVGVAGVATAATAALVSSPVASRPAHETDQPGMTKIKSRASIPAVDNPDTASPSPHNASNHALSQVPTAEDHLSRAQTKISSGMPSRQSTAGGELDKRTSAMSTSSIKSKSKRKSRRSSKPEPLKYFTYDDVAAGEPPKFGQPPQPSGLTSRNDRSIKGKEREHDAYDELQDQHQQQEHVPQVPELPTKLAHMDLSGTGLTRSSTRETGATRGARRDGQRVSAPVGNQPSAALVPGQVPPQNMRSSTGAAYNKPRDPNLAISHGLDFSDIPAPSPGGARRAPAPPPPVNMTNKPPSKRPSREFKGGVPVGVAAAGAAGAAGASAIAAGAQNRSQQAAPGLSEAGRASTFQEDLPEALRHAGVEPEATNHAPQPNQMLAPGQHPVLDRTRQAMGSIPATHTPGTPGAVGDKELGFVSAPSSPAPEKGPFVAPAAGVIGGTYSNGVTARSAVGQIREERLTREVHTYNVNDPSRPIVNLEVLSKRYFMQIEDGRFVEILERDVPTAVTAASTKSLRPGAAALPSQEFLSSQNI